MQKSSPLQYQKKDQNYLRNVLNGTNIGLEFRRIFKQVLMSTITRRVASEYNTQNYSGKSKPSLVIQKKIRDRVYQYIMNNSIVYEDMVEHLQDILEREGARSISNNWDAILPLLWHDIYDAVNKYYKEYYDKPSAKKSRSKFRPDVKLMQYSIGEEEELIQKHQQLTMALKNPNLSPERRARLNNLKQRTKQFV